MVQYLGDFAEDATVYIPFNTFTSDDPAASATITNLADADIKVHKDGSTTEITTDGATVAIDFDSITGNHLITIDTSADAAYSTGSDYMVRIEGTTVDAGTINAWVGSFSIENRQASVNGISTLLTNVAAILTDTGTTLPATLSTIDGKVDTVDTNVDAVLADTGTDGVVVASINTGAIDAASIASNAITAAKLGADCITAAKIADDALTSDQISTTAITEIWNHIVETNGSVTAQQVLSVGLAVLAGETSSGGAVFSDPSGTNTRVTATVNGSNERTAITLNPSS